MLYLVVVVATGNLPSQCTVESIRGKLFPAPDIKGQFTHYADVKFDHRCFRVKRTMKYKLHKNRRFLIPFGL